MLTQARLTAVVSVSAVNITTTFEKGKQPLNDELESVKNRIERFNPQEPLFLLIDYFHCPFTYSGRIGDYP